MITLQDLKRFCSLDVPDHTVVNDKAAHASQNFMSEVVTAPYAVTNLRQIVAKISWIASIRSLLHWTMGWLEQHRPNG
jgi:hypothetical protein